MPSESLEGDGTFGGREGGNRKPVLRESFPELVVVGFQRARRSRRKGRLRGKGSLDENEGAAVVRLPFHQAQRLLHVVSVGLGRNEAEHGRPFRWMAGRWFPERVEFNDEALGRERDRIHVSSPSRRCR